MGCGSSISVQANTPGKADVSAIEIFDFEYNLDNVKVLYDYGNGQYIYPKDGRWDYDYLNSSSGFTYMAPKLDKKSKARISKIDDVITMRNFSLEQKKEMEDTSLWDDNGKSTGDKILPVRVLPIYNPGDTISGHLVLEVSELVDAKQIKILCSGITYFYIDADEFLVNHIEEEKQLWYKSDKKETEEEKCDGEITNTEHDGKDEPDVQNEILIIEENKPSSSEYIPVGRHRFPFSFKIPDSCPASVPNIASGTFSCICISYRLKALIERGTIFGIGNVVQYRGFWVTRDVDIVKRYPEDLQPTVIEREFESSFTDARTMVKVTIPRNAFKRGEAVNVELELDNTKGDADIESIEGKLTLEGKLYSTDYLEEEIELEGKLTKLAFSVAEGKTEKSKFIIPFDFTVSDMDNHLMPIAPDGLQKNEYVADEPLYYINLKVVRKGLQNENFKMKFPIKVGTLNGAQQGEGDVKKNMEIPDENVLYE